VGAYAAGGQPAPGRPGEPDDSPDPAPSAAHRPPRPEDVPTPLTRERLTAQLHALGYHYFVDSEGDVGGLWFGRLFHFFLIGDRRQVLQVRGRWNRRIAIERLPEVLALCDRWNRELLWPKCYVRVLDDGRVHVMAEVSTPFGAGATDAQIRTCIQNGLATSGVVFDALDERYPDPAGSPP
jgi:hypothetical protein